MKFHLRKVLEDLEKDGFERTWEKYSSLMPKDGKINLPKEKGISHSVIDALIRIREGFLDLGFEEVINPIIVDESEVYKQYGPEAPIILDRVFYLAGLPRPDIGLDKETINKIRKEVGEINIEELRKILREYRERKIEADDLIEIMKEKLEIDDHQALKLLDIFKDFFRLKPEPTSLTLRSHMTGAWFMTISEILEYKDPPLYLFSIDWVFRREQKEDESHLRYYHSASVVVVDPELNERYAFEITKKILEKVQEKLNIKFKDIEFRKRRDTARYYAKDKEWEVYADFKGKKYEIGTFGFYSPISLARYSIPYPVYNFGMGLERIVQIITGIEDIRKLVFRHRYFEPTDEEIARLIRKPEPKTEWGKKLANILITKVEEYKDRVGPFKELVYEDDKVKVHFLEPDEGKKFAGPATFNRVYVQDGNIISSTKEEKGVYLGRYVDFIIKGIVSEVEEGKKGYFKTRWVEGLSDICLEVPSKLLKWLNEKGKKIQIQGPVFLDILVE
jgi:O-phosphoseryl-tRNA synthetase